MLLYRVDDSFVCNNRLQLVNCIRTVLIQTRIRFCGCSVVSGRTEGGCYIVPITAPSTALSREYIQPHDIISFYTNNILTTLSKTGELSFSSWMVTLIVHTSSKCGFPLSVALTDRYTSFSRVGSSRSNICEQQIALSGKTGGLLGDDLITLTLQIRSRWISTFWHFQS